MGLDVEADEENPLSSLDKWTSVVVLGDSEKNSDFASAVRVDRGELLLNVSLLGESRPSLQSIAVALFIRGVLCRTVFDTVSTFFVLMSLAVLRLVVILVVAVNFGIPVTGFLKSSGDFTVLLLME